MIVWIKLPFHTNHNCYFVTLNKFLKGWKYILSKGEMLWSSISNKSNMLENYKHRKNNHKEFILTYCNCLWKTFKFVILILFFLLLSFFHRMTFNATIFASLNVGWFSQMGLGFSLILCQFFDWKSIVRQLAF